MSMSTPQPATSGISGFGPVVVMGVSGCGKSAVGQRLAHYMGCCFIEGDSLYSPENVQEMNSGPALDDTDRWPWLPELGNRLSLGDDIVVSCSTLKRVYRDQLRIAAGRPMTFVFLEGTRAVLASRLAERDNDAMPCSLLDSQLNTLEPPIAESDVITIQIDQPLARVVALALAALVARNPPAAVDRPATEGSR